MTDALCEDCPPIGYSTDKTRCEPCPRRSPKVLDAIVDKVLAYRPTPKSAPAKRRKRRAKKLAKKAR